MHIHKIAAAHHVIQVATKVATKELVSAFVNMFTGRHALIPFSVATLRQFLASVHAAEWFLSIFQFKNAEWFLSTTQYKVAAMYQNTTKFLTTDMFKEHIANHIADTFHNTTGNVNAVVLQALLTAEPVVLTEHVVDAKLLVVAN
jgi:hypothetical protein